VLWSSPEKDDILLEQDFPEKRRGHQSDTFEKKGL
jgi:hypothetical protein